MLDPLQIGITYVTRDGRTAVVTELTEWSAISDSDGTTGGAHVRSDDGLEGFVYKDGSFVGRADSKRTRPYDLVGILEIQSQVQLDLFDL